MAKINYRDIAPHQRLLMIHKVARRLSAVKNRHDMEQLLTRMFTQSELVMLGRRLQIADLLIEGKSYQAIRDKLGVGFATIQATDKWLDKEVKGYDKIRSRKHRRTEKL